MSSVLSPDSKYNISPFRDAIVESYVSFGGLKSDYSNTALVDHHLRGSLPHFYKVGGEAHTLLPPSSPIR